MTTRSQKRKAVEELVSTEIETPVPEISLSENPVAGTSKSPRVISENLENIKSALRKEIMTDLTKILAENQKEMLKLIAPVTKKQTLVRASEETDSDPEDIPENATSTPIKTKSTATTNRITPVNSRNNSDQALRTLRFYFHLGVFVLSRPIWHPVTVARGLNFLASKFCFCYFKLFFSKIFSRVAIWEFRFIFHRSTQGFSL